MFDNPFVQDSEPCVRKAEQGALQPPKPSIAAGPASIAAGQRRASIHKLPRFTGVIGSGRRRNSATYFNADREESLPEPGSRTVIWHGREGDEASSSPAIFSGGNQWSFSSFGKTSQPASCDDQKGLFKKFFSQLIAEDQLSLLSELQSIQRHTKDRAPSSDTLADSFAASVKISPSQPAAMEPLRTPSPSSNDDAALQSHNVDLPLLQKSVAVWLKLHRLHKYTEVLSEFTWSQLINLTDDQLLASGVQALGARRKLLRLFEQASAELLTPASF